MPGVPKFMKRQLNEAAFSVSNVGITVVAMAFPHALFIETICMDIALQVKIRSIRGEPYENEDSIVFVRGFDRRCLDDQCADSVADRDARRFDAAAAGRTRRDA